MKTEIKIRNEASVCTIDIEGVIGVPEESQFAEASQSVATYERFREEISRIKDIATSGAKEVVVNIRSTGGDVNDALLIYETLASLDAKITTRCYGYTASAATIIAQAASEGCREIALSALYLVHMSSSAVEGNSTDLAERIELLKKSDDRIASLYALRSGRDKGEFEALMGENGGRGRWLTPEEAVEAGLADAIIGVGESAKSIGIIDRVRGWFSSSKGEGAMPELPYDINILHTPDNRTISTSTIALREGQCAVTRTELAMQEDPALEGSAFTPNALAYAEDARNLKFRGA
ncbi:MAG: Clp protease ClpP [Alistipes sp.]|nr:Clp protease ClpP [Alistipes sp.]